jgi:hypothetical protein
MENSSSVNSIGLNISSHTHHHHKKPSTHSYLNTYYKYLLEKAHKSKIVERFLKPNKNLHFTSSNLYYYFDRENSSFDRISDIVSANLKLYKQDLFEDLEATDHLYEINDDGSYSISN